MKTRKIETFEVSTLESFREEMVPRLGFQRKPVYRGQASAEWSLIPSLYREDMAKSGHQTWTELEAAFLISLKQQARGELPYDPASELEWMALGAQHGLPTRLSSWSENALVALFYATDPAFPCKDGVVWRIMPGESNFTIAHDFEQIPDQSRLYLPRRLDAGMRNQRVCFLSHPLPLGDAAPQTFEQIYKSGSDRLVLSKMIIPADSKHGLRRDLALLGIDHQFINPGLNGLCRDLREEIYHNTDSYDWISYAFDGSEDE
ncbi:MAG: FRG domain-containing protein [Verrucomicrobiales bacterium]|nr:FRG domain-containing protein [Verrucomicrobiales bacterium]